MSIVVGVVDGPSVILGSDSQITDESGTKTFVTRKVFQGDKYVLGAVGDLGIVNIIKHFHFSPSKNHEEYFDADFPGIVKSHLESYGYDFTSEDKHPEYEILVGYRGSLYFTDCGMNSFSTNDHTAIGSGSPYALGSLHSTNFSMYSAQDRVRLAIGAASELNISCGGPLHLVQL